MLERVNLNTDEVMEIAYVCLSPVGTYPEEITRKYMDLDMYIRVILPDDGGEEVKSFVIRDKSLADAFGGIDHMFDVALENTREKAEMTTFADVMRELGMPVNMAIPGADMGIARVKIPQYGAGAFLFPELFAEYCRKNGVEKCFICPSSIHEVICYPAPNRELGDVSDIVGIVNDTELAPGDVLGSHAYLYDAQTGIISY